MPFGLFWSEETCGCCKYFFLVIYVIFNNKCFIRIWKNITILYMGVVCIIIVLIFSVCVLGFLVYYIMCSIVIRRVFGRYVLYKQRSVFSCWMKRCSTHSYILSQGGSKKPKHVTESRVFIKYLIKSCVRLHFITLLN